MKTTVEIPDTLYRQIKARAALKGQSIKDYLVDAVRAKIASDKPATKKNKSKKKVWPQPKPVSESKIS